MKQIVLKLVILGLALLVIVVMVINIIKNSEAFFEANIIQVLTLLVALLITFWANQYKTDHRKAKEHAEKVIVKLQKIVMSEEFYVFKIDVAKTDIQVRNRRISNYIEILKTYSKLLKFEKEIEYICSEFEQYRAQIDEHLNDAEYLKKTEPDFRRISNNIDSKCEEIMLLLYKV